MLRVQQAEAEAEAGAEELLMLKTGGPCNNVPGVVGIVGIVGVMGVLGVLIVVSVSGRLSKPSWDLRNLSKLSKGPRRLETVNGKI